MMRWDKKYLLHTKYATHTMVNRETFVANLDLAERVMHVPGIVVECGVWRGGMIAAIAEMLGNERHYVLADSFRGLPSAQPIDGQRALDWQASDPDNCRADANDARDAMRIAGITQYQVVEGWFSETLAELDTGPIVLLRLDADWYDSTMCCLSALYNKVVPGGIIIVDDYYVWDGCSRAVHTFLSSRNSVTRIREHDGVAYMVKQ